MSSLNKNSYMKQNFKIKISFCRHLDKNEYNHITATYFLLAERRLRMLRQEQGQLKQPNEMMNKCASPIKQSACDDVVDGSNEIQSGNLLAPPNMNSYNRGRNAADGTGTTVSIHIFIQYSCTV